MNTGNDAREQAAASSSAVGEGQLETLLEDFLYGKRNLTETADAIRASQAPKPASAGGEPAKAVVHMTPGQLMEALDTFASGDEEDWTEEIAIAETEDGLIAYDIEYPDEGGVSLGRDYRTTIAAEADTAKPVACGCDGIAKIHVRGESAHCIHYMSDDTPPDRLAPIETRPS